MDRAAGPDTFRELFERLPQPGLVVAADGQVLAKNALARAQGLDGERLFERPGLDGRVHRIELSDGRTALLWAPGHDKPAPAPLTGRRGEAFGDVAAALFGDLRNLFAPVSLATEMLARKLEGQEALARLAKDAHAASALAAKLLRGSLDYMERSPPPPERFCPARVISSMEPVLEAVAGDKVSFSLEATADGAAVVADPVVLERLVLNLVSHARDVAVPAGNITVSVQTQALNPQRAREAGCDAGEHVEVNVRGHGPGALLRRMSAVPGSVLRLAREAHWGITMEQTGDGHSSVSLFVPRQRMARS